MRDYTFFSSRCKTYSQIDLILVSDHLRDDIASLSIGLRAYSDHVPGLHDLGGNCGRTHAAHMEVKYFFVGKSWAGWASRI